MIYYKTQYKGIKCQQEKWHQINIYVCVQRTSIKCGLYCWRIFVLNNSRILYYTIIAGFSCLSKNIYSILPSIYPHTYFNLYIVQALFYMPKYVSLTEQHLIKVQNKKSSQWKLYKQHNLKCEINYRIYRIRIYSNNKDS